jgi:DNA primase
VVVEGYVDVVIAHQAGFKNVVATLGTAITERHLRQLARLAPEITMALDPDAAGQHAMDRSVEVARAALSASVPTLDARGRPRAASTLRATITIAVLPDGKDPDELILQDPERWRSTIANASPVIDHALRQLASQHDLSTARGKSDAGKKLAELLLDIPDPIEQAHYVELAAEHLGLPDSTPLRQELRTVREQREAARKRAGQAPVAVARIEAQKSAPREYAPIPRPPEPSRPSEQDYAIALAVAAAQRGLPRMELDPSDFTDPTSRALALRIAELQNSTARSDWRPDLLELAEEPWSEGPIGRVRGMLAALDSLSDAQLTTAISSIARQLRRSRLLLQQRELAAELAHAEAEAANEMKAWISALNREIVALARADAEQPRGPSAVGRRIAVVPSRFRLPVDN